MKADTIGKDKIFMNARDLAGGIPLKDLHIHTKYSDGKSTVKEYVKTAAARGYKEICFTDHVDFTTTWFDSYANEISGANSATKGLNIFYGVEVRARDHDGSLNAPDDIIKNAEIVIGVVHSIPAADGRGKCKPEEFSKEELLDLEYSISLKLLENRDVSVLGHPMSNYEKLYGPVPEQYYRDLISKARKTGTAIEINAKYNNDFRGFLELCMELNPRVSLGSDAHSVHELGMISAKLREEI